MPSRPAQLAACTCLGHAIFGAPRQAAFYLFIDVPASWGRYLGTVIRDVDHFGRSATEAHIAVVPGSGCGDENSIRISYAVEREG